MSPSSFHSIFLLSRHLFLLQTKKNREKKNREKLGFYYTTRLRGIYTIVSCKRVWLDCVLNVLININLKIIRLTRIFSSCTLLHCFKLEYDIIKLTMMNKNYNYRKIDKKKLRGDDFSFTFLFEKKKKINFNLLCWTYISDESSRKITYLNTNLSTTR